MLRRLATGSVDLLPSLVVQLYLPLLITRYTQVHCASHSSMGAFMTKGYIYSSLQKYTEARRMI